MPRRILASIFALAALASQASGFAQTPSLADDPAVQVQAIAPQLIAFAGSDTNFRSLVQGLSQGIQVTLVTFTADGLTQTVTFTPASALSATDIARTLEAARQQLIARGVAAPTAQQIGTVLAGGNLPTPAGTVAVNPAIATVTPGGVLANASAGASAPILGTTNGTSNLNVDIRQSTVATPGTGIPSAPTTPVTAAPNPVVTSPNPVFAAPNPVVTNPNPVFSNPNPIFAPTPAPATTSPNGAPPAAVQMQGHR